MFLFQRAYIFWLDPIAPIHSTRVYWLPKTVGSAGDLVVNTSDKHKQTKNPVSDLYLNYELFWCAFCCYDKQPDNTASRGKGLSSLHFRVAVPHGRKPGQELRANTWGQEWKPEECCFLLGTSLTWVPVLTVLAHLPRDATVHCGPHPPLPFNGQDNAPQIQSGANLIPAVL